MSQSALLNTTSNSTSVHIGKAWLDARLGCFKTHFSGKSKTGYFTLPEGTLMRPPPEPLILSDHAIGFFSYFFPHDGRNSLTTTEATVLLQRMCCHRGFTELNSTLSNTEMLPSPETSPVLLFHYCSSHKRAPIKTVACCLMNQGSVHPLIFLPPYSFPVFICHIQ